MRFKAVKVLGSRANNIDIVRTRSLQVISCILLSLNLHEEKHSFHLVSVEETILEWQQVTRELELCSSLQLVQRFLDN